MSDALAVQKLTREAFAPFGELLDTERAETRLINAGACTRFHALATVETLGQGARVVVSVFRTEPTALPVRLSMMERHPLGGQAFWPLANRDWLVAVAPDENGRPGAPLVFRASGRASAMRRTCGITPCSRLAKSPTSWLSIATDRAPTSKRR